MRIPSVIFLMMVCLLAAGQSSEDNIQEKLKSDTLYWYGLDLSKLKVFDYMLVSQEESFKSIYCPQIIGFVRQKYPVSRVQKDFNKKKVVDYSEISFRSFQNLDSDSLVYIDGNSQLSYSDIQLTVSQYDPLPEHGLGLVVLVVGISRTKKETSLLEVFFDIKTKKILYVLKSSGRLKNNSKAKTYAESVLSGLIIGGIQFENKFR